MRRRRLLEAQRQRLPVWAVRSALLEQVRSNRALILVGETGSGKTTQIPRWAGPKCASTAHGSPPGEGAKHGLHPACHAALIEADPGPSTVRASSMMVSSYPLLPQKPGGPAQLSNRGPPPLVCQVVGRGGHFSSEHGGSGAEMPCLLFFIVASGTTVLPAPLWHVSDDLIHDSWPSST